MALPAARAGGDDAPAVVARGLSHFYGEPPLRRQILFDVDVTIAAGDIVIVTGPSGSGKTTFLTLVGGLRAAQQGSLQVLGHEIQGASTRTLVTVRRQIGYIFQAHNLLDALTATENVMMALQLHGGLDRRAMRARAAETLAAVGLGDHLDHYPAALSGGQKQRVAIARALASAPRLILADEPTASLDKQAGRDVVELMHRLAKEQDCTVLLVTHDNRILDVADRIVHLEDGRLSSFTNAVLTNTRQLMEMLAVNNRKGELVRRLQTLPLHEFVALLGDVTTEFRHFLQVVDLSSSVAFHSALEQVIEAFTMKVGAILDAERCSLLMVDAERGELWSAVARGAGDESLTIRIPLASGIAGRVARTGESLNLADAYTSPDFNRDVDATTGYRTRSLLCVPIRDEEGVFAVAELLNKSGGTPFDARDERRFQEFASAIGVLLKTWWQMSRRRV